MIVEGCVKHWPAMRWSRETLLRRFGALPFAAGAADFPLELWYDYAQSNTDDVAGPLSVDISGMFWGLEMDGIFSDMIFLEWVEYDEALG